MNLKGRARVSILASIISLSLFSCSSDSDVVQKVKGIQELPVISLIKMDTTLTKEYVSEIYAEKNVEIRARVTGFLEKIYVDEGQDVYMGQPLFRINSEEYQAALAKAKANLKSAIANAKAAELEIDRVRLLVEKKVISESELEVAKSKLIAAEARIEEAKSAQSNAAIRLSYTFLKSPFNGIIDRIPLKVGSLISHGTLLTTVSDNSNIFAYFSVSESEYLNYQSLLATGSENSSIVELTLADGTDYAERGKIETMEGQFDASTGTIAFRAKFPNPTKILKHGSSGKVRLTSKKKGALILPQKAAFEVQDRNFVFVVDSSNHVTIKSFQPETRFSHFYIVKSGLKPGDKIVYEGIQGLKEGMEINPEHLNLDSLIKEASKGSMVF